ncbi:MAG TPA: DUF6492 family protein [Chthonomonadaceae bacterium]|nr:DUF6492 family protein [Chthonomonadaceae bacterium]
MSGITLVTPTYGPDLERFLLQRESLERCGITLPHIAVVQDEDLPLFRKIPFQRNLTLLSTREVLPPQIERRRVAYRYRRRHPKRWFVHKPLHGWYTQQFVKLAVANIVQTEGYVCVDADIFYCDRLVEADFYAADGRLHLYETTEDLDVEMAEWLAQSMRFLGIEMRQKRPAKYIHALLPMHTEVVREMIAYIEDRHKGNWAEAMVDHHVTEYMTYGAYARYLHHLKRVVPAEPTRCLYYWWADQIATMQTDFPERLAQSRAKAVLVQSNLGRAVRDYRALAELAWSRVETTAEGGIHT